MVESEYAKAVYELALDENKEEVFKDCFNIVLEGLKDKDFDAVLSSPFIDKEEKKKLVKNIYKALDETFLYFLYVLIDNHRISLIRNISDAYNQLLLEKRDILKIQIYSAVKLSSMQMIHLTESLQQKYKDKKIELENIVNDKLIGGIQIVSGGESMDMSLKNSLAKLRDSL